jgi:hypothetical protein
MRLSSALNSANKLSLAKSGAGTVNETVFMISLFCAEASTCLHPLRTSSHSCGSQWLVQSHENVEDEKY